MARRPPRQTDQPTVRELDRLLAAIEKLNGTIEKLDARIDAQDKILQSHTFEWTTVKALVDQLRADNAEIKADVAEFKRERADRAAIAKHTAKWRAAAYGAAGLVGAAIPHVIAWLK